jgi:anti-sigma B factor antagonist
MVPEATRLEMSHRTLPTGEEAADIEGELDIATADEALKFVQEIIDSHHGPVVANLAGIRFCDARGLRALLRMAAYAEQAGCSFRVVSPSPMMTRLMRITQLDGKFLAPRDARKPA